MDAPLPPDEIETSEDCFLDGRVRVLQPRRGHHRAGLDALLLAAAVPEDAAGMLVDFGAGAGVAGLAAAARAPGLSVTLVERDGLMADLARRGLALPGNAGLAARARVVEADVLAPAAARIEAGLAAEAADWLIVNPPFHGTAGHRASPHAGRRSAHALPEGHLALWMRSGAWALRPGGRLALIFRADGLGEVLAALGGRFGQVAVNPVFPRTHTPAHRIVVTATKGSRSPLALLPGLVLHPPAGNGFLPAAEAILRGRAGLGDDGA